jgi:hypothetical protein
MLTALGINRDKKALTRALRSARDARQDRRGGFLPPHQRCID